ncbi:MAG TPA: hypothetical protein VMS17_13525, partial [Gemmataceae bacterium]|nr:hypothetical protein [Gemmataceae bacterium]
YSVFCLMLFAPFSQAQDAAPPPLKMAGLMPGGVRGSATESWGTFGVEFLTNPTDVDRTARLLLFFESRPNVQYGRDIWVPAHSSVSTWMLTGPAGMPPAAVQVAGGASTAGYLTSPWGPGPLLALSALSTAAEMSGVGCNYQTLLYDRSDGTDRLILPPGNERVRAAAALYRYPEPSTAVLLNADPPPPPAFGQLPRPDSPDDEAVHLALMFRQAAHLSDHINRLPTRPLPPTEQAFSGIDHLIVASDRIADDPAGMRALRHWVEQGGRVWVLLDRVDPDKIAPLLGDALDFQLVDRVGLTSFPIEGPTPPDRTTEERPVDFARVLLPAQDHVLYTIQSWPLLFTRQIGQGKAIFTTLGPRGWYRWNAIQAAYIPRNALTAVAQELQSTPEKTAFQADRDLRPLLTEAVGYWVVSPGAAALIFGGALLAALLAAVILRKARRRELLGWICPLAALGAAGVFFGLGEASRRSAPATAAMVQLVDAVPDSNEAAVRGVLEVYGPNVESVQAAAEQGGFYELDAKATGGQTRRFIQTDLDAWHWDESLLSRDPRFGSFHAVVATDGPMTAVAHFGPNGLEGKLSAGPFHELADAVLTPPNGRGLAVHVAPDGAFHAGADDVLPLGQYLAGAVLSDRQQRRQVVYQKYLSPPKTGRFDGPDVLHAWAKPIDLHFTPVQEARLTGDALLDLPLHLERPPAGTHVTIPGPLVRYRQRRTTTLWSQPTLSAPMGAALELRFQLPGSVLPFQVESARVSAKFDAPDRRVKIAGLADGKPVELFSAENPTDPIRIDLADERFHRLDADGCLHLNVSFGDAGDQQWKIEYLEIEVAGTVLGGP